MSTGWSDIKYRQDMPPPGGYGSIPYKRNLPVRGPSGYMMFGLVTAITLSGFRLHLRQRQLCRDEMKESLSAEKLLIPLMDAEKDRHDLKIIKETVESEALNIVGTGYVPDHKAGDRAVENYIKRYTFPKLQITDTFMPSVYFSYQLSTVPKCGP
uniref:NADH dehydrogenase [ubiquinone] 1 alpha subcomplex subunit 13 n=1 Tax=Phallusia mammillata TaxID=59560 RepID=A0A6F9DLC9_9ASCI|nr:NADH dehydrogenase [ubiquinone] 1 alpha subcomplex subunit 13-like [Phallusia mammillata]